MDEIIALSGGRVAGYEVIGTGGTSVLMLSGGPGAGREYMKPNGALFANVFTSYLLDPHGSGHSTPPADPSGYSFEGHARFYEDVRQALGLGRVVLLGHSFGASTALTYAALFPDAVAACIAVAPYGIGDGVDTADAAAAARAYEALQRRHAGSAWYQEAQRISAEFENRVRAATDGREIDEMLRALNPFYFAEPDRPEVAAHIAELDKALKFDLGAIQAWQDLAPTVDLRPLLGKITCPTLILAGELDFVCGPAQARPIAREVPGARLVIFPGSGHFPDVEARDAYRNEVASFTAAAC